MVLIVIDTYLFNMKFFETNTKSLDDIWTVFLNKAIRLKKIKFFTTIGFYFLN